MKRMCSDYNCMLTSSEQPKWLKEHSRPIIKQPVLYKSYIDALIIIIISCIF